MPVVAASLANLIPGKGRGRPKGWKGVAAELRSRYGEGCEKLLDAIETLANDPETPPAVKLGALQELMSRGVGRPVQHTELEVALAEPETDEPEVDYDAMPHELRERVYALTTELDRLEAPFLRRKALSAPSVEALEDAVDVTPVEVANG